MESDDDKPEFGAFLPDLPGIEPEQFQQPVPVIPENPSEDANVARIGYHTVLTRAQKAASQLHELSHIAQHPRMFEVLGQLMRVELEAADRLRDSVKADEQPKTVNNTLVLNSTEILDLVKKKLT